MYLAGRAPEIFDMPAKAGNQGNQRCHQFETGVIPGDRQDDARSISPAEVLCQT